MINPLTPVIEWFLALYNMMPYAIKAFVSLSLALFLVKCLFSLFFRSKH